MTISMDSQIVNISKLTKNNKFVQKLKQIEKKKKSPILFFACFSLRPGGYSP